MGEILWWLFIAYVGGVPFWGGGGWMNVESVGKFLEIWGEGGSLSG